MTMISTTMNMMRKTNITVITTMKNMMKKALPVHTKKKRRSLYQRKRWIQNQRLMPNLRKTLKSKVRQLKAHLIQPKRKLIRKSIMIKSMINRRRKKRRRKVTKKNKNKKLRPKMKVESP